MNVRWILAALASVVLFSSGCEPFTSDDDEGKVKFINRSSHRINVSPNSLGKGWSGFSFAPGETVSFNDAYDVYFTFEPRFRVKVAENTDGRIIFIDAINETVKAGSSK